MDSDDTVRVPRVDVEVFATRLLISATLRAVLWHHEDQGRHVDEYDSPVEWSQAVGALAVALKVANDAPCDDSRSAARALVWQQASDMGLEGPLTMHVEFQGALLAALYNPPPGTRLPKGSATVLYDLEDL